MNDLIIVHHPESQTFTTTVDGHTASLDYRQVTDQILDYTRTFVPIAIRHRGIANALTTHALEYASQQHFKVIPSCWFVAKVMRENPAYAALEAKD